MAPEHEACFASLSLLEAELRDLAKSQASNSGSSTDLDPLDLFLDKAHAHAAKEVLLVLQRRAME